MSECTGRVLANECVNCNGLGIWKGSTMHVCLSGFVNNSLRVRRW